MSLPEKERQGYLPDLSTKSYPELQDLLDRQNKLLNNVSFISKLPDGGARIHAMVERIQTALTQQEAIDETTDLLQRMDIQSEQSRRNRGSSTAAYTEEEQLLRQLATRGQQQTVVVDERNPDPAKYINSYDKVIKKSEKRTSKLQFRPNRTVRTTDVKGLSEKLSAVSVQPERDVVILDSVSLTEDQRVGGDTLRIAAGDEESNDSSAGTASSERQTSMELTNNYLHVDEMENSEKSVSADRGNNITNILSTKPVTSLTNCKNSSDSSQKSSAKDLDLRKLCASHSKPGADLAEAHGKLKYNYDELLQTQFYTKHHNTAAKMISIEESATLQTSQQKTVQELQALAAAEKLASRLHVRMETYNPEGHSNVMSYRDKPESGSDIDSDDDDVDYPE